MSSEAYLKPIEDGLELRPSGGWAIEKLDYLRRYIDVFETSMRDKWAHRAYVDLFSGPGKCVDRKTGEIFLGSPLVALTTRYPFTEYWFADNDQTSIEALSLRYAVSPYADRVSCIKGDSREEVTNIVSRLREVPSLNLAFLDPEGLELEWGIVESLAEVERMDLIIHYPQMGLNRLMPVVFDSETPNEVDSYFGGSDWKGIYNRFRRREESFLHRQLMDHYKNNLSSLGYQETLRDDEVGLEPLMSNELRAPLYRLLFASKHRLGIDFWRKITSRDVKGQRRLL
jgi:three-Cys-motif partner protein